MASDQPGAGRPHCPRCGGELRLSHREYAGRGRQVAVRRCRSCGEVVRSQAAAAPPPRQGRGGRAKRPIDEGAPSNTVLDPETAARILGDLS